ncbi:pyridoxamine 5'-phosphate oxidase family protein [Occultella gossypii]|uniref:Pyridoxamine 5'-phosphate oxidase family protein n=1 Tax=Occultella gossypii TaxID=2800820 RepID=A0ABS7S7X0_9MICO|nr:pyridoxamine 5'-phosphate oxidase family protein [Occultella gossypii]MBZ2195293.1 pyridoxamine 5'-phosphate oxidase family protein [Occultella gossypii]
MTANITDGPEDDGRFAREVIDTGHYLVLATADAEGNPWPTPVWYARDAREFVWVSRPEARHSRNIEVRPRVGLTIFATPVPVEGRTHAVYADATAAEVPGTDRDRCLAVFDRRARAEGLGSWTVDRVVAPANLRLYRARVTQLFVLHPDRDVRRAVAIDL